MKQKDRDFPAVATRGLRWRPFLDLYHFAQTLSWPGFLLWLVVMFLAMNFLFALGYAAVPGCIEKVTRLEDAFYFSVQSFATIGYGDMHPVTRYGHAMVTLESAVGLLCVALVTGVTFSRFARPTARVRFADKMVIHERDGVPHLVMRLANERHNTIVEAQLRVLLLLEEVTAEGESIRIPFELPLVRERTAVFIFTWVPMHRIDEKSPLYGGAAAIERLRKMKAEFYLSLSGLDETIGQTVHARTRYDLDDIAVGQRFQDVLELLPDGTRFIDYTRFDELVPAPMNDAAPSKDG